MYPTAQKDPRGGHNRSSINQKFFQTWSPSMTYILGFIFADGAIEDVQKSSRTCYLSIGISVKDILLLEEIKTKMESNHTIYRRKEQLLTFPGGKQYLSREKVTLRIGSKLLYNDLLKLGVTPKKSIYSQLQKSNNLCYQLHCNTKLSRKILEFMYKDLEKAPFLDRKYAIYRKYLEISNRFPLTSLNPVEASRKPLSKEGFSN